MRILILTQWFNPEPDLRSLLFATALRDRGHSVQVLTGFPNYPGGKLYPGYRLRLWDRELMEGITITRVPLYPSHDLSPLRRACNYFSFAISATVLGPFLIKRPDVIYVYHPPLTISLPAFILRALFKSPIVYDVQDLWPDSVAATGMLNNPLILKVLEWWSRITYRSSDQVTVLSPGFKTALVQRGVSPERVHVIYNWCNEPALQTCRPSASDVIPDDRNLTVLYAGNMGPAQGLDTVLEAAHLCATSVPHARFLFIGTGAEKGRLERKAVEMGLDNVRFLPRRPMHQLAPLLAAADVLLVHLKDHPLFRITVPSKTQTCLAAGKLVLMAVDGDAAEIIRNAHAGIVVPPEDGAAMADAVRHLAALTPAQRAEMGKNGQCYYLAHMSLKAGVDRFETVFRTASKGVTRQFA